MATSRDGAGAFVALFRFHGPFLLNEGHLFVLFQPARQCQALAGGDILPPQPLNALFDWRGEIIPYSWRQVLFVDFKKTLDDTISSLGG